MTFLVNYLPHNFRTTSRDEKVVISWIPDMNILEVGTDDKTRCVGFGKSIVLVSMKHLLS